MTEQAIAPRVKFTPLGLPKGSVRALIALMTFGTLMGLLLENPKVSQSIFWQLWMVNYVILGYYFAHRQGTGDGLPPESTQERQPLHLPKGTVRWLIVLMFLGTSFLLIRRWLDVEGFEKLIKEPAFFPLLSLGSFFFGRFSKYILGMLRGEQQPSGMMRWFYHGKSLLALCAAALLPLTLLTGASAPVLESVQRASFIYIVFYFGVR